MRGLDDDRRLAELGEHILDAALMPYTILVTPTATEDIAVAIEYYNLVAPDLGYRFADLVAEYFNRIAELPTASAIRYKKCSL